MRVVFDMTVLRGDLNISKDFKCEEREEQVVPLTKHMHTATASYASRLQKLINLRFKINKTKQTDIRR